MVLHANLTHANWMQGSNGLELNSESQRRRQSRSCISTDLIMCILRHEGGGPAWKTLMQVRSCTTERSLLRFVVVSDPPASWVSALQRLD